MLGCGVAFYHVKQQKHPATMSLSSNWIGKSQQRNVRKGQTILCATPMRQSMLSHFQKPFVSVANGIVGFTCLVYEYVIPKTAEPYQVSKSKINVTLVLPNSCYSVKNKRYASSFQTMITANDEMQELELPRGFLERCMRVHGWGANFANRALNGYRRFMKGKLEYEDWNVTHLSPSTVVDQVWHQHILHMLTLANPMPAAI